MSDEMNPYCNCLFYSANALARLLTKMAEEEFARTNLAPTYAFLLMTVNKKPGVNIGEVAQTLMLTPSTLTRLIDKMVGEKYLEKRIEGKYSFIFPTQKSIDLDKSIRESWRNLYNRYIDIIGKEQSALLTDNIFSAVTKIQQQD